MGDLLGSLGWGAKSGQYCVIEGGSLQLVIAGPLGLLVHGCTPFVEARRMPKLVISSLVEGYNQLRLRPWQLFDLARLIEESMNDLRVLGWLTIEAKLEALESPAPMDKRILIEGSFVARSE